MEDVERRSHPSLPANYVSFLDLRERWMKQQQQKKQVEEIEKKEVQDISELQVDQEQVKPEVENKDGGDDNLLEERHPDEISVVQSNPNPNIANRRPSNRKPWHGKEGNKRWVPLKEALIRAKQAPSITSNEPGPVDIVKQKPLPLNLTEQSKPPLLEIPKVETVAQAPARIRGSDEKFAGQKFNSVRMWKAKVRNRKRNLKEDLLESQLNKGVPVTNRNLKEKADDKVLEEPKSLLADDVLAAKAYLNGKDDARVLLEPNALAGLLSEQSQPPPLETNKVDLTVQPQIQSSDEVISDSKLDTMMMKKTRNKPFYKHRKRNQVEGVTQPHLKNENLAANVVEEKESTEQEVGADNNAAGDNGRAETGVVTDLKLDRVMKKKKPSQNYRKRNQKVESVSQPHLKKENLAPNVVEQKEAPEQEVGADSNAAETEGKFAGLSVIRAPEPEPSCSSGSFVARKWNEWRNGCSYEKIERPIMMKKERAWGEGSLIWVKKGESSQTGYVAVKNSGNIRV